MIFEIGYLRTDLSIGEISRPKLVMKVPAAAGANTVMHRLRVVRIFGDWWGQVERRGKTGERP
jgi:hypothetical protein